ncbi:hypothetical protein D1872_284450 [compost metagenome]
MDRATRNHGVSACACCFLGFQWGILYGSSLPNEWTNAREMAGAYSSHRDRTTDFPMGAHKALQSLVLGVFWT